jgi:hypothetical protein
MTEAIVTFLGNQTICFVDKQDAVKSLIYSLVDSGAGLSCELSDQTGSVGFHRMATRDNTKPTKRLAENSGHGRFSGTRVADKNCMQAHNCLWESLAFAFSLNLQKINQAANLSLDGSQPNQFVQFAERFGQCRLSLMIGFGQW